MSYIDFREIANARISSRIRQVLVLMLAILIGILISVSTNAKPCKKAGNTNHYRVNS